MTKTVITYRFQILFGDNRISCENELAAGKVGENILSTIKFLKK
jgi:hypothetical protein